MLKALFTSLSFLLCTLGYSLSVNNRVFAQVTSDGTVNTEVNDDGKTAEITGGETRGDNLFHSFEDFSVKTGNEAFFNNANSISNIFSRVTGGNVSDINGAIRANGSASLFLINPAGIIFGENASLNIGGSFYGSSASSILFEDGEFSAADLDNPPLLTVNAPIGLGFRDNSEDIVINGDVNDSSLIQVTESQKNLNLIGGNLDLNNAALGSLGGNVTLGGLQVSGIVKIDGNGNLNFPENLARGDISLDNTGVFVDAGSINLNGNNIEMLGNSYLESELNVNYDFAEGTPAGNINLNATETIDLTEDSSISTIVNSSVTGNAGNIEINAAVLSISRSSRIDTSTFGEGNAGNITLKVSEDINLDQKSNLIFDSGISSIVKRGAKGNGGDVEITATNLSLTNGADINASTFGEGDGGTISINASESITLDGTTPDGQYPSGIFNVVSQEAKGNSGSIEITTTNLSLTNGAQIDASTFGQGNAGKVDITVTGDIIFDGEDSKDFPSGVTSSVDTNAKGNARGVTITTNDLNLTNGGRVDASTFGQGNAGLVDITATGDLTFDGEDSRGFPSGVNSQVDTNAKGNAGGVTITTNDLNLTNGGRVDASTSGQGDAGAVNITATGDITANGGNSGGFPSGIYSQVSLGGAEGNAEGVTITTNDLNLTNGGVVSASTFGQGDAGNVIIDASESILIRSLTKSSVSSGIYADAVIEDGNGGNINISTNQLTIANGGTIEATNIDSSGEITSGTGQPGNIFIQANNLDLANTSRINAATQSPIGESGKIDLQVAEDITLRDNSFISAQAFKDSDGGNLNIDARFVVAFPNNGTGNDLVATAEQGTGGNINLNAEQIFGLETGKAINDEGDFIRNNNNDLDVSSDVFGFDGSVNINISDVNPVQGATELPSNVVEAKQATEQTCSADRDGKATNGLAIAGRGGVSPAPDMPLNSEAIGNENPAQVTIPEAIETSQGKIQPARGIMVTKSGKIVLTAYRTNNAGERIPEIEPNCKKQLEN